MSHQLIVKFADFDRGAFDVDAENRGTAGLTLLQLWRGVAGAHWALFEVKDADKARRWIDNSVSLGHGPSEHHFLETA
ncbi:hypothetical protein [Puniceibacterium sp. IMCC21224]|uniref:hypothetical protein n=1 Tax=Puniceibacterium sp. IMCC21224 TaxID=1618204 RepID=UPI00064E1537|nr:hypothetical protein [Puniceibacterium sp. IMCC21224]KMK66340.1 hypothetical protein IMCC21224_111190 [Puniceibacterium sp. IMCC21224]